MTTLAMHHTSIQKHQCLNLAHSMMAAYKAHTHSHTATTGMEPSVVTHVSTHHSWLVAQPVMPHIQCKVLCLPFISGIAPTKTMLAR